MPRPTPDTAHHTAAAQTDPAAQTGAADRTDAADRAEEDRLAGPGAPADDPSFEATGTAPAAWRDLEAYVALPRLGTLLASAQDDLLVSVTTLNEERTAYSSAWWMLDPDGLEPPRRFTRSVEGESEAAFLSDGSLLFTSKRRLTAADGSDDSDTAAIWCLPAGGGEAYVLARRSGGWQSIASVRTGGLVVFGVGRLASAADEEADARLRVVRKKRKVSAILHEGYPVRHWDHDLGLDETRLLAVDLATTRDVRTGDLAPQPTDFHELLPGVDARIGSVPSLSAEGGVAAVEWQQARTGGETVSSIALIDLDDGSHQLLATADDEFEYTAPMVADDGSRVVCVRQRRPTPDRAEDHQLWLVDRAADESRLLAGDWDAWPEPQAWSPDGETLYVTVDEDGHAPIYAVDVASGERRRLTGDGAFSSVRASAMGATVWAIRTSYTDPGSVVSIDAATGTLTELPVPVSYPDLPGRLAEVETVTADGVRVRGHLALPEGASASSPAPLALWVHGGPLGSWNAWSWRWCPWLLVAAGYAVLLPDPALSTGYGLDFVQRGWAEWGDKPYTDLMDITDAVEGRSDIADGSTVAMGGSFGGYMANWIAGHTDRFAAIVTHASLWNLEGFGATTDASWYWARQLTQEAQSRNSPHRFADRIHTPMLVIHGDKDYRVPISEGLALWWELVSGYAGDPAELPHKFLYFPDENHWVLTPQHAIVWYETVLAFLESTLGGGNFVRPQTL